MAKANYIQPGACIDYQNSGSAKIAAGEIVPLTNRIGVAAGEIEVGKTGALMVEGVFDLPLAAATAVDIGAACYYVSADENVSTTAAGNIACGWCVAPAAAGDTTVRVKIG